MKITVTNKKRAELTGNIVYETETDYVIEYADDDDFLCIRKSDGLMTLEEIDPGDLRRYDRLDHGKITLEW